MLFLCEDSKYNAALEQKINSIEKAREVTKNRSIREIDRKIFKLDKKHNDKNAEICSLFEYALSLQQIFADKYKGQFLSPIACQAAFSDNLEINILELFSQLGFKDEIEDEEKLSLEPNRFTKQDTKPLNLNYNPKRTNNSVDFTRGTYHQQKTIDVRINREDTMSEEDLNENATQAGSIKWSRKNATNNPNQPNYPTKETGKSGDASAAGDMVYLQNDGSLSNSSSSKRLEIRRLTSNSNVFGFKKCDEDYKEGYNKSSNDSGTYLIKDSKTTPKDTQTTQGRTADPASRESQSGQHIDSRQPSSEERKRDREKSLGIFDKKT